MYSWKNCSPISTEHLLSKNSSMSSYQGIFLPRCTGHATDQNAEYIAKDDNLVFLPHNKDMSKETSQELGIVCHSLFFQVTNIVLHWNSQCLMKGVHVHNSLQVSHNVLQLIRINTARLKAVPINTNGLSRWSPSSRLSSVSWLESQTPLRAQQFSFHNY